MSAQNLWPYRSPSLGSKNKGLRFQTGDAGQLSLAEEIMRGEGIELLRQQRRKRVAERSGLDADDLGVGVVTADQVIVADDLARRTVQVGQLFEFAAGLEQMDQTRSLDPAAVLIDDGAHVIETARGARRALEPGGSLPAVNGRNQPPAMPRRARHDSQR